ncbi:MAG: hypothetical protein QW231_03575 [Candidatus Bathyarchaeia archaeon]
MKKSEDLVRESLYKVALAVALALIIYGVYRILSLLPLPISLEYVYNLIMAFIAIYVGYVIYRMGRGLYANMSAVELGRLAGSLDARTLLTISMGVILLMGLNTINPTHSQPIAEATKAPFKLVTTLEKTSFALGENVIITIKLVNMGVGSVTVDFRYPPVNSLGFRVYDVFNRLVGRSPIEAWAAGWTATLEPGGHVIYIHEWSPKLAGTFKVKGSLDMIYAINGVYIPLTPPDFTFLETPPIEITIT